MFTLLVLCVWSYEARGELSGQMTIDRTSQSRYTDGEKTQTTESLFTNLNLSFTKPITTFANYQLYLRARLRDTDTTDAEGNTTSQKIKELEPSIQFNLNTPFYKFRVGYRVNERDVNSDTTSEGKKRDQLLYSFLGITPYNLPSLYLQIYKQKVDDEIGAGTEDMDSLRYTLSSYYKYNKRGFKFEYNLTYTDTRKETPGSTIFESRTKTFSGLYEVAYSTHFWEDALTIFGSYKGSYTWNKNKEFSSETGDVLVERNPFGGFYALGTVVQPSVDYLSSQSSLVDNDLQTGISSINLTNDRYHNIGIGVSSLDSVDMIYLYVNRDVSSDPNLSNMSNWKVYRSNVNASGATWTEVPLRSLSVTLYDPLNNIYRYEFEFQTSQNASYFKVVNLDTVSAIIPDVLVTEIEAHGIETIPTTGEIIDINKSFQQEVSLNANYRILKNLYSTFSIYTKRVDTDMPSFFTAFGKVFQNIISDPGTDTSAEHRIDVTRSYAAGLRWEPHRLLTTEARVQRYEVVDNKGDKDYLSNSYSLSFVSAPLDTLTATLTLLRTDSFKFNEKQTTNDSVILSVNTRLYWNVNLTKEIGFRKTRSYTGDTETKTTFMTGTVDARLTDKLTSYLTYNFNWVSTDAGSYTSKGATLVLNYRPGRLFNISGTFSIKKVRDDTSTSEGTTISWQPVRKLKLDVAYLHSKVEPGPTTVDSYSTGGTWYITKFLDFRLTYGYNKTVNSAVEESYNLRFLLNGRI